MIINCFNWNLFNKIATTTITTTLTTTTTTTTTTTNITNTTIIATIKKTVQHITSRKCIHYIRRRTIIGKYNKSDKKKFLVGNRQQTERKDNNSFRGEYSYSNKWKLIKEGKYNEKKKKENKNKNQNKNKNKNKSQNENKENIEERNIFLNRINYKDTKKETIEKKTIIESSQLSNVFIKKCLQQKHMFYMYTYQYLLIELLKHKNILVNFLYSDTSLSYILYALYKIEETKQNVAANMHQQKEEKFPSSQKEKNNKRDKIYKWSSLENCVLFLVCSNEYAYILHETIIRFKSSDVSVHIIYNNENDCDNINTQLMFNNILIVNIKHMKQIPDNLIILFENINYLVIDDISEIYKNKKSELLPPLLHICKKRQQENSNFQILLINKTFDEWIIKEIMSYLENRKYTIKKHTDIFSSNLSKVTDKDCFIYVNLRQFKKCSIKHSSLLVSMNEDKKFLILFYILNKVKDKRVIIYYRKKDLYHFYNFVHSYFPCLFLPNTYKEKSKAHLIQIFNTSEDRYILITDDKILKKKYPVLSDIYIFYNFVEDANTYADMLSDAPLNANTTTTTTTNNNNSNNNNNNTNNNSSSNNNNKGELHDMLKTEYEWKDNIKRNTATEEKESITGESILFYNKKECKEYETLNGIFHYKKYILPSVKTMKDIFIQFLIREIENETITDKKYVEEAHNIYEKYGANFISAALNYIQKKKLFKKNWKNISHSNNVTFIVERNILLHKKEKILDFLNTLLNWKKNVGDISFFIQNYYYTKRGYIFSVPEVIYNTIHKNKNSQENVEKYKQIHLYILYNNYERLLNASSYAKRRGSYQSKMSLRRLKRRLNKKNEQKEIGKLRKRLTSIFRWNRRNANRNDYIEKTEDDSCYALKTKSAEKGSFNKENRTQQKKKLDI